MGLISLPDGIISDILLRLHVKCLIRCTAVCKPWKAMIKSSKFIYSRLNRTTEAYNRQGTRLLLHHGRRKRENIFDACTKEVEEFYKLELFSLHYDNHVLDKYREIYIETDRVLVKSSFHLRVAGICKGLICIADDVRFKSCSYILWNPYIRKTVTLPRPAVTYKSHGPFDDTVGFGFDALTNDYKVVRLVTLDPYFCETEDLTPTLAEVYSLATGSWTSLGGLASAYNVSSEVTNVFFNGAIHWALKCWDDSCTFILTFDVGSEAFGEIMMPESIRSIQLESSKVSVTAEGKSLALFTTYQEDFRARDYVLDIWVMEVYGVQESWTRLKRLGTQIGFARPLSFRMNGEVFLLFQQGYGMFMDEDGLFSLDLATRNLIRPEICRTKYCFSINQFEETLVLLDVGNAISY